MFALRAMAIEGVLTGTLVQAQELMALARSGTLPPLRIAERPLTEAQSALDDLRSGRVIGRLVLAM
jgi:alcohol dehydrogenase